MLVEKNRYQKLLKVILVIVVILLIVPYGLDNFKPLIFGWIPWWMFVKLMLFGILTILNALLWLT